MCVPDAGVSGMGKKNLVYDWNMTGVLLTTREVLAWRAEGNEGEGKKGTR